ncbi:MAG: hypothetical protein LJF06_09930 [Gemmatimonadetes bacterium]|nr:hypothetical protein [Gemmatimonadota bacterium]
MERRTKIAKTRLEGQRMGFGRAPVPNRGVAAPDPLQGTSASPPRVRSGMITILKRVLRLVLGWILDRI